MEDNPFMIETRDGTHVIVGVFLSTDGTMEVPMFGASKLEAKRVSYALREAYERGKATAVHRIARGLEVRPDAIRDLAV